MRAVTKPTPLPPISLRLAGRRLGAIALAWEPNVETDLLGYRLLRWRKGRARETIDYVGTAQTRAEDIRVGAERAYDYALIAVDRDGLESRPSTRPRRGASATSWRASASPSEVRLRVEPAPRRGLRARAHHAHELARAGAQFVAEDRASCAIATSRPAGTTTIGSCSSAPTAARLPRRGPSRSKCREGELR